MRGPRDRVRSTTRLPAALREELGIEHAKRPKRVNAVTARKQARREKRRKPQPETKRRRIEPEPSVRAERQPQSKAADPPATPKSGKEEQKRTVTDPITGKQVRVAQKKGSSALAALTQDPEQPRAKRKLKPAEKDEEDEIAWLEHQLYGRKKTKSSEGDDLDCA